MRNLAGPPVSGDNFLFRERELRYVQQALIDGNSLSLFGLRRIGKTSLMHEVKRRIEQSENAYCCMLDVQDVDSASRFFLDLMNALPTDAKSISNTWMSKAKTMPARVLSTIQRTINKGGAGGWVGAGPGGVRPPAIRPFRRSRPNRRRPPPGPRSSPS